METSLRYGGDSKSVRFHAKEKFPIDSKTFLQVNGELDTNVGGPTYYSAIIRHFYPESKLRYTVRGKKAFPLTSSGLLNFVVKGRCDADKEFKERKGRGAAEVTLAVLNFQKDQDVRFKIGYEMLEKVPYFQIGENNWTLNANIDGKWNIRFDL
ncbi:hypothetical protein MKX01_020164 [Papaver californicum]|nr:hypothetical protein MKX01_020164 [Papaver californicum]